jgi:hypothetical protein
MPQSLSGYRSDFLRKPISGGLNSFANGSAGSL